MHRILFVLICAVTLAVAGGVADAQVQIPLPESHWAYEELSELAGKGLVSAYTPFDFKGRASYTREDIARIIEGIIDRYQTSPESFNKSDLVSLKKLREEFAMELSRRGENRQDKTYQKPPPVLPSTHWAYAAFADFARRGFISGVEENTFLGGRIISRDEAASYVLKLEQNFIKQPQRFTETDKEKCRFLQDEFREEMLRIGKTKAIGIDIGSTASVSGKKKRNLRFSSNFYTSVTKSNKSTITDRLTAEKSDGKFQAYYSGNMENSGKDGADVDFGSDYTFDFTRKLVAYHSNPTDAKKDSFVLAGDINNVEFANGLILGSANVKGAYASALVTRQGRINALWGVDGTGRELLAARIHSSQNGRIIYGGNIVKEIIGNDAGLVSYSVDVKKSSVSKRIGIEYASGRASGDGLYASLQRDYFKNFKTSFEFRNYRDFIPAHNNPRIYVGRSGGNEENEKSFYAAADWRILKNLSFYFSRDHAFSLDSGRRTNVFWSFEYQPSKVWQFGIGREKERGANPSDSENSFRLKYSGFKSVVTSLSWKRSLRSSGPTGTTRIDIAHPAFGKSGRMLYSFTRRRSSARRTNSSRMRFSKNLSSNTSYSLSYDYSKTAINKFDANLAWKF